MCHSNLLNISGVLSICFSLPNTSPGVPLETMIKFKRLASLSTDFEVLSSAMKKSKAGLIEVGTNFTIEKEIKALNAIQISVFES